MSKLSIVVPQAIGISLRNRIGDSAGEFLVVVLWGNNGLDILDLLSVSPCFCVACLVCSSIDTPLYWFDPWPAFYHCLLFIRRFFAKKLHTHMDFWPKVTYTCRFLAKLHVYMQVFGQNSHMYAVVL